MGLAISLGGVTKMRGIDDPWVRIVRTQLEIANELFARHGLPPYQESQDPERLDNRCPTNNFGYDAIHFLRRAYARHLMYCENPVQPVPEGTNVTDDDALRAVRQCGASHLVCHSDTGGMYLPADFDPVLSDRRLEGEIGSSYRLMEELLSVAPAIGLKLDNGHLPGEEVERLRDLYLKPSEIHITDSGVRFFLLPTEQFVWFSLYEAARLSIQHGILIWFS